MVDDCQLLIRINNLNSGFPFNLGSIDSSKWQAFIDYLDHLSFTTKLNQQIGLLKILRY